MNDAVLIKVPRRNFLGWFASVASFEMAGIGRVAMTFCKGELHLKSDWGETRMSYEGDFEGGVDISTRSLVSLVKRYYRQANAPTPLTLCLEVNPGRLSLDAKGVKCVVTPAKDYRVAKPKTASPASDARRFLLAISYASLKALMKKLFSGVPRKEAVLFMSVSRGKVAARCGAKLGSTDAETFGEGRISFQAASFCKILSTYEGESRLEIEGNAQGLRINSFKMPVIEWNNTPEVF